jgi:hypothetical protein
MPTTQSIEAGQAPAGIGPPAPLDLGPPPVDQAQAWRDAYAAYHPDVTQATAPPPIQWSTPPPPATPSPQIVDRQEFLHALAAPPPPALDQIAAYKAYHGGAGPDLGAPTADQWTSQIATPAPPPPLTQGAAPSSPAQDWTSQAPLSGARPTDVTQSTAPPPISFDTPAESAALNTPFARSVIGQAPTQQGEIYQMLRQQLGREPLPTEVRYAQEVVAAQQAGKGETNPSANAGSLGSMRGTPDQTGLEAAASLAGEPFRIGSSLLSSAVTPVTDRAIRLLPEPLQGPTEKAVDVATGFAPYLVPLAAPLAVAQLGLGGAVSIQHWKDGQLSTQDLAKQLGTTAAMLVGIQVGGRLLGSVLNSTAVRGGPIAIEDMLQTPEGDTFARRVLNFRVNSQGQLELAPTPLQRIQGAVAQFKASLQQAGGLASETGSAEMPFGDVQKAGESAFPGEQATQSGFDATGAPVEKPVMPGDTGTQGALLGSPAQTGEGLTTQSAGPLFANPGHLAPEVSAQQFGTTERFARVPTDQIRTDPALQARATDVGQTFSQARVNDIVNNYNPDLMTPLIVAPDPKNPGGYVVGAGFHRLAALKAMGLPADVQIANLDLRDPAQAAKFRSIADASNATQHPLSLKERITVIDRAGTQDVGQLRSQFPAFNDQQIRDAQYISQLPGHVIDKLDKLPESSPLTGIAAEVGYGQKAYGLTPQEGEALFNRLTASTKAKLPTRAAVRETIDKFGAVVQQRDQMGMFAENAGFGASNRILDAMVEHARLTKEVDVAKRTLLRDVTGAQRLGVTADSPQIVRAQANLDALDARKAQLETDFLGALRGGNESAIARTSSTEEARGIARTASTEGTVTGTQPPSTMPSTVAAPPSGLTTLNNAPQGALEGGTSTENIAPSIPPTTPELAHAADVVSGAAPDDPPVPPALSSGGARKPPADARGLTGNESHYGPPLKPNPKKPVPPGPGAGQAVDSLRPIADVEAEVKTNTSIVGHVIAKSGINPLLDHEGIARLLGAYERQRIAVRGLADAIMQSTVDTHFQRFTGVNALFKIKSGVVTNVKGGVGKSRRWNDIFSRPNEYSLTPDQRAMVDDVNSIAVRLEELRVEEGLPARAVEQQPGEFYVPRQVEGIRGVELRRPANPNLQRIHDLAEEGAANGVDYSTDIRATIYLNVLNAYREMAVAQFTLAAEKYSIPPTALLPAAMKTAAQKAGADLKRAGDAILAVQRALRGEQIPTSTVQMVNNTFPELHGDLAAASELKVEDLIKAGQRAAETGHMTFKPMSPGGIRAIKGALQEAQIALHENPKNPALAREVSRLRQSLGFARYRFGMENDFRQRNGIDFATMLENPDMWTKIDRSTKTLLRATEKTHRTSGGDVEKGTQKEMLHGILDEIRGEAYAARTASGTTATRYRGGLMEPLRAQIEQVRRAYTRAMESARKSEVAPGSLFGPDQPETIGIVNWRNRFFTREDGDLIRDHLDTQRNGGVWNMIGRGVEIAGNETRFLATAGDVASPVTHGLFVLGRNPVAWGRGAWLHYQAIFDPTVLARYYLANRNDMLEMARYGLVAGDNEFFAALDRGGGVSAGAPLEFVPGGANARSIMREIGRQTYGRSKASYQSDLAVMRTEMWKSLGHLSPTDRAHMIRNMTGGLDSAALGANVSQRQFESVLVGFAPKLFRSTIALLADMRNPTTPVGREAWRTVAGMAAAVIGLYVLLGKAMGRSDDEIKSGLNPLGGKTFLSYNIDGDWIGWGGVTRALIQMVGRGIADPSSLISGDPQGNPFIIFYQSRGAPAVDLAKNIGQNWNDPIAFGKHLGTQAAPFVMKAYLDGTGWLGMAAQGLGLRTSPSTPYEHLTDRLNKLNIPASQFFGEPGTRQQAIAQHPELQALYDQWQQSRTTGSVGQQASQKLVDDAKAQITKIGDAVRAGQIAPSQIKSAVQGVTAQARIIRAAQLGTGSQNDRLQPLYALYDDPANQGADGQPDLNLVAQAQEDYLQQHPDLRQPWNDNQFVPKTSDSVEVMLDKAKKLTNAKQQVGTYTYSYYGVDGELWQGMQQQYPELKSFVTAQDYSRARSNEALQLGQDPADRLGKDPYWKAFTDSRTLYRDTLLDQHPDVAAALRVFYGVNIPNTSLSQAALDAIAKQTRQLYKDLGIQVTP